MIPFDVIRPGSHREPRTRLDPGSAPDLGQPPFAERLDTERRAHDARTAGRAADGTTSERRHDRDGHEPVDRTRAERRDESRADRRTDASRGGDSRSGDRDADEGNGVDHETEDPARPSVAVVSSLLRPDADGASPFTAGPVELAIAARTTNAATHEASPVALAEHAGAIAPATAAASPDAGLPSVSSDASTVAAAATAQARGIDGVALPATRPIGPLDGTTPTGPAAPPNPSNPSTPSNPPNPPTVQPPSVAAAAAAPAAAPSGHPLDIAPAVTATGPAANEVAPLEMADVAQRPDLPDQAALAASIARTGDRREIPGLAMRAPGAAGSPTPGGADDGVAAGRSTASADIASTDATEALDDTVPAESTVGSAERRPVDAQVIGRSSTVTDDTGFVDELARLDTSAQETARPAESSTPAATRSPMFRAAEITAIREMFEQIDRQRLAATGTLEIEIQTERFGALRVEAVDAGEGVELQLRSDADGGGDLRDLAKQLQQEFDRDQDPDRPVLIEGGDRQPTATAAVQTADAEPGAAAEQSADAGDPASVDVQL